MSPCAASRRMNGSAAAMGIYLCIDPAEEAHHREVMDVMGVYDAEWALSKVLQKPDVQPVQNRLLLIKEAVRAGPIPKLFPELEELRADGLNAQRKVNVTVLDTEGRENVVQLRYLSSNKAYRIMGPEWKVFVLATGMSEGDRLDLYTCKRGDGELHLRLQDASGGAGGTELEPFVKRHTYYS